jgi:rod shape-determining protein MreD
VAIELLDKQGGGGAGLKALLQSIRLRLVLVLMAATVLLTTQSVLALKPTLRPDVATLVIVYLAMEHELIPGLVTAILVGYLADVFSGEPPGLYCASLVIVYLVLRLIVLRIVGSRWFIVTGLSILATFLAILVRLVIESALGPHDFSFGRIRPVLLFTFFVAALGGYPIYRLMGFVERGLRADSARQSALH